MWRDAYMRQYGVQGRWRSVEHTNTPAATGSACVPKHDIFIFIFYYIWLLLVRRASIGFRAPPIAVSCQTEPDFSAVTHVT